MEENVNRIVHAYDSFDAFGNAMKVVSDMAQKRVAGEKKLVAELTTIDMGAKDPDQAPIPLEKVVEWFGEEQPSFVIEMFFDPANKDMTIGQFRAEVRKRARERGHKV